MTPPVPDLEHADRRQLTRRFLALALPLALSNLTVPLTGMVDMAMLGHLGRVEPLAGMGLATALFNVVYWSLVFLVFGTAAAAGDAFGRGDRDEVFVTLYRSAAVGLILGVAILLIAPALRDTGLAVLAGTDAVKESARDYFNGRIVAAPAVLVNFAIVGWLSGVGRTRTVLGLDVASNGANVVLDYLFIFSMGWEGYGAGLATALSQYLMLALGLAVVARERPPVAGMVARSLEWEGLRRLLLLQRDLFLRLCGLVVAYSSFTHASAAIGTTTLAANTVLLKLLETIAIAFDGFSIAMASMTAQLAGAGAVAATRRLLEGAFAVLFVFGLAVTAALAAGGERVLALLTVHGDVVDAAAAYQPWLSALLVGVVATYVFDGLMLGLQRGNVLRNAVLGALVVYVPLAWFGMETASNTLLWSALVAFMTARVAIMAVAARSYLGAWS